LSPKLRSLLARVFLIGGIALVASLVARSAPHDQTVVVRLNGRQVSRVSGVITREGDSEPSAGFSQDFPGGSPGRVRHTFAGPNDTYIVVITFTDKPESSETQAPAASAQLGAKAPSVTEQLGAKAPSVTEQLGAKAPSLARTAAPNATETGGRSPIPSETSFERRVSLAGGEVLVSPD
jgi:hypothetical protein